jgi:hypothetical protein
VSTHWERTEQLTIMPRFYGKIMNKVSDFRKVLADAKSVEPCAVGFWKRKLNEEIGKDTWSLSFTCTKETRLRVLQWKLLHNIYPTNIMLNKMKVVNTNKCDFCTDVVDFVEHFFYECPRIHQFWKMIEQLFLNNLNICIHLTVKDVLFGVQNLPGITKRVLDKINCVILIAKMCISIYKKTKSKTPLKIIFDSQMSIRNMSVGMAKSA